MVFIRLYQRIQSSYKILVGIILVAIILRFWQLGIVPAGVTHDELGYMYNSYSIAKTGQIDFNMKM